MTSNSGTDEFDIILIVFNDQPIYVQGEEVGQDYSPGDCSSNLDVTSFGSFVSLCNFSHSKS